LIEKLIKFIEEEKLFPFHTIIVQPVKVITKIFFVAGLLFWGFGLMFSFVKLVALNGLSDIFEMKNPKQEEITIKKESSDISISYTYVANNVKYCDSYVMVEDYYEKCAIDTIIIKYNASFPQISYIEGLPLKQRNQKINIIISSILLLFLILLWKMINRRNWIKTYEKSGNRPWLFPDDNTIKNPWLRIKNRLFKKY